jgi:hypothetical protein
MMRSSASLALALVAPLAFASGCANASAPARSPAEPVDNRPPPGWRDPSIGKETRSPGMVGAGIGLIAVGATMLPIGSLMWGNAGQTCSTDRFGNNLTCEPSRARLSGLGVVVAGAGGLAVGIPLLVLGAQKVPIEIPRRSALVVGPTGASFRCDF